MFVELKRLEEKGRSSLFLEAWPSPSWWFLPFLRIVSVGGRSIPNSVESLSSFPKLGETQENPQINRRQNILSKMPKTELPVFGMIRLTPPFIFRLRNPK